MREHDLSSTAVFALMTRAAHQKVDGAPKILADPVSLALAQHLEPSSEWAGFKSVSAGFLAKARSALALRARYAEDVLSEVAAAGHSQYVILGAGLDTFAWRQPEWTSRLTVFEVDHPATQAQKRRLFGEIGLVDPANLRFCPMNFETTSLPDALAAVGFDFAMPTMVSWLGVTQYLSGDAIRRTLAFVQTLQPGSRLVFSFVVKDADLDDGDRQLVGPFMEAAAARGEPFLSRFSPPELLRELSAIGYRTVHHFSPEEANRQYFAGRIDDLCAPVIEQLMRATV
jgi:methyltransferase (TIGR00027 family)